VRNYQRQNERDLGSLSKWEKRTLERIMHHSSAFTCTEYPASVYFCFLHRHDICGCPLLILAAAKRELSWTLNGGGWLAGGVRKEVSFGMEWTSFASS
jgi:hypothetical protein